MITPDVVVAYAQCPRKAYKLLYPDTQGIPHAYLAIVEEEARKNRANHVKKLLGKHPDAVPYSPEGLHKGTSIMIEGTLVSEDLQAYVDVLTRMEETGSERRHPYTPTLLVGTHKISKEQKLQLAFIGYVLSKLQKEKPAYGTIMGGGNKSQLTVLETLYKDIGHIVSQLRAWTSAQAPEPPPIILNRHCSLCQFSKECEAKAKEQDHLSLLKSIRGKEIMAHNTKGIFTVTQLSYTYRPRKRRQGKDRRPPKYSHSLKALAIRDHKIYVVEKPAIPWAGTLIFLDVEGVPDQDFYYLIGLLVTEGDTTKAFSFWADEQKEEEKIWREFLAILQGYSEFTLFHYGSYEIKFIEWMSKKYESAEDKAILQKIASSRVNVLALIYANIYFPTYSNSLKDIGLYLGQRWTEDNATGLQSLVWRHTWETTRDLTFKKMLLQYNSEDCHALKLVTEVVYNIAAGVNVNNELQPVETNDLEINTYKKFKKNGFLIDGLDFVNKCAYFDYQREKIFFRNKKLKKPTIKNKMRFSKAHINKFIEIPLPMTCYKCGSNKIFKRDKLSKKVFSIKFINFGIKRWIIKYSTSRVSCSQCNHKFRPYEFTKIRGKYGHELYVYMIYQHIALRQPFQKVIENLQGIFGFSRLPSQGATKKIMSQYYEETYNNILMKLQKGKLIHADETEVSIQGVKSYIWVFTSLEVVLYVYSPTREGDILDTILKNFNGVLISDYYGAYDAVPCLQQKCLIHLIRDMNDDLLKNQFDEEYRQIVHDFGCLIKSVIMTIDKYGLKKVHLQKHNRDVNHFYDSLFSHKYKSDIAIKYQWRFKKYQDRLFTFLNHDDVPWNNNNAEHAIKGFAAYRNITDGLFTENGIKQYLTLFSIYQTCNYKGVDFLRFMLSRETDIDQFREYF
jgi:predicted RecB family nuclease